MRSALSAFNEVWQCQFKQRIVEQLAQFHSQAKIVLACSGGMDSMLLLELLAELIPERLQVVSIDHQLQVDGAQWSAFVAEYCRQKAIFCRVVAVQVAAGNVEAEARKARYQAFFDVLMPNDVLVLAHHQQDQAETVLLHLLQGSGVSGLAAMRECELRDFAQGQYWLWRPLLSISKQKIHAWVNQTGTPYVHDPMNFETKYDRVWCREVLWTQLAQRFPAMQNNITRCAILMQDAEAILADVLQQDMARCIDQQQKISLVNLAQLSLPRQRQLLSTWMQGEQIYRPPLAMVERLQSEVIAAREDAQSVLHCGDYYFVRFDGYLYRYRSQVWLALQVTPAPYELCLCLGQSYRIALGQLSIQRTVALGLDMTLLGQAFSLIPRKGGEKITFYGRKGRRVLKKELQAAKIAPWKRHQIQILMYHNVVLGVCTPQGFWLAESPYLQVGGWLPYMQDVNEMD